MKIAVKMGFVLVFFGRGKGSCVNKNTPIGQGSTIKALLISSLQYLRLTLSPFLSV